LITGQLQSSLIRFKHKEIAEHRHAECSTVPGWPASKRTLKKVFCLVGMKQRWGNAQAEGRHVAELVMRLAKRMVLLS
jgi:hypothetical protein